MIWYLDLQLPMQSMPITTSINSILNIIHVYVQSIGFYYEIELAFDAILGHKSAHSFATGPVIAEPAKEKQNLY
jgi:hypothetical protein